MSDDTDHQQSVRAWREGLEEAYRAINRAIIRADNLPLHMRHQANAMQEEMKRNERSCTGWLISRGFETPAPKASFPPERNKIVY